MKISNIFESINREVSQGTQGRWCTFIRIQGCNLYSIGRTCGYCDSPHAFDPIKGIERIIKQIVKK